MDIFILRAGQETGPYTPHEVHDRLASGRLTSQDLGWHEGESDWKPLAELTIVRELSLGRDLAVVPGHLARVEPRPPTVPASVMRVEPLPPPVSVYTRTCPFCAEEIKLEALKCKHCGEVLDPRLRAAEEAGRARVQTASPPVVYMNAVMGGNYAARHDFPHLLHFLLSVVTAGIWLPIWFLFYVFRSRSYYY
jgi:hypothetical protein